LFESEADHLGGLLVASQVKLVLNVPRAADFPAQVPDQQTVLRPAEFLVPCPVSSLYAGQNVTETARLYKGKSDISRPEIRHGIRPFAKKEEVMKSAIDTGTEKKRACDSSQALEKWRCREYRPVAVSIAISGFTANVHFLVGHLIGHFVQSEGP
jgi:hypothetical protein